MQSIELPYSTAPGVDPLLAVDDFENPTIPGLCYHVNRTGLQTIDGDYKSQYKKDRWGDHGAGLYVLTEPSDALGLITHHGSSNPTSVLTLRHPDLKILPSSDNQVMARKFHFDTSLTSAYRHALTHWANLSAEYHPDKVKDGVIRNLRDGYFRDILELLDSIDQAGGIDTDMRQVQQISDLLLPEDMRSMDFDTKAKAKVKQYGPLYMREPEIFGLFLQSLGYDGISYLWNSKTPAMVVWSYEKVDTQTGWRKRSLRQNESPSP